jgi:NAD dependent epimerase/dehydratase family enzyme
MGSGEQWLSWIHPLDALRGIQFLIGNSYAKGPYNLAAPIPVTNEQFTESIGNVLGKPSFFRVPGVLLRTALGEVSSTVLEGQHVLPKALTDLGFEFRFANIEAALENLLRR